MLVLLRRVQAVTFFVNSFLSLTVMFLQNETRKGEIEKNARKILSIELQCLFFSAARSWR